jgi:heme exporter protein C
MKNNWYKVLAILALGYVMIWGFLGTIPRQPILYETARNLYFHVPMWFSMFAMFGLSVWYSVKYLNKNEIEYDDKAAQYAYMGIVFGLLGLITGSIWSKYTWSFDEADNDITNWWPKDVKTMGASAGVLIYLAYAVLRDSFSDEQRRGRISAIYNIFAISLLIPLLIILPRTNPSLHPGDGGDPGFKPMDTAGTMRVVFYPACIGWILMGLWISSLRLRLKKLSRIIQENK